MTRGRDEFDRWADRATWHQAKIDVVMCSLNGQQTVYSSPGGPSLILGLGEVLFYAGSGQAALVGEQIRSHYVGGSSRRSVRIGPLRVRSGQSRGRLVRHLPIASKREART